MKAFLTLLIAAATAASAAPRDTLEPHRVPPRATAKHDHADAFGNLNHYRFAPLVTAKRYHVGEWRLSVRRNPFTGQVACRLTGAHVLFQPGAIGFQTRADGSVMDAWYRIDGSPARAWHDLQPALVEQGISLASGGLDNPTRGVVWLPLSQVRQAHDVIVQASVLGRPQLRRFKLDGFAQVYAVAARLGCPRDGYVV